MSSTETANRAMIQIRMMASFTGECLLPTPFGPMSRRNRISRGSVPPRNGGTVHLDQREMAWTYHANVAGDTRQLCPAKIVLPGQGHGPFTATAVQDRQGQLHYPSANLPLIAFGLALRQGDRLL